MNDNKALVLLGLLFFAFIAIMSLVDVGCGLKNPDPIAERIKALDGATFGMSNEAKERILIEALKGDTNSIEEAIMLEREM